MPRRLAIIKCSNLLSACVLAIAACAPQPSPPPPTAAAPPPSPPPPTAATTVVTPTTAAAPGTAAGSPPATTTYYDGTYIGSFTQNQSASGSGCPNFPVAPALTIHNGVAQFAALDITYQGYVTPQGDVTMQSPAGQTLTGHIDPYYVLRAQTTGRCVYNAAWQRKEGRGPYTGG
jgi:hypothetical protein